LNYKWLAGGGLTDVDRGRESLRFGEHSEAVAEVGHVVGGSDLVGVLGLPAEEGHSGVELRVLEGGSAFVDGVEETVQDSGVRAALDGEGPGLASEQVLTATFLRIDWWM
jgi:hypothetical protein